MNIFGTRRDKEYGPVMPMGTSARVSPSMGPKVYHGVKGKSCPSPSLHLIRSRNLLIGHQSCIITHAFTTAHYSFLSCTIILPGSIDISHLFNALFTLSIHLIRDLPFNLTPFAPDPITLFTNQSSSILSLCLNHFNTHCSTSKLSYNTNSPLHFLVSPSAYPHHSTHIPQTPHLHYI